MPLFGEDRWPLYDDPHEDLSDPALDAEDDPERILGPATPAYLDVEAQVEALRRVSAWVFEHQDRMRDGRMDQPNADPWIMAEDAVRLAELWTALDGWLKRKGELPIDWRTDDEQADDATDDATDDQHDG